MQLLVVAAQPGPSHAADAPLPVKPGAQLPAQLSPAAVAAEQFQTTPMALAGVPVQSVGGQADARNK